MAEYSGSLPDHRFSKAYQSLWSRVFFGATDPQQDSQPLQPRHTNSNSADGNQPPGLDTHELILSTDFIDGIRYGLHRLDQVLEHYTMVNGYDLYSAFSIYISTMREVGGESWTPGYWDGIFETVIRVKEYEDSAMRPKNIYKEIKKHFGTIDDRTIHNWLTDEQRITRRTLIGMLASNFHPDSFFVKTLSKEEQLEREEVFKNFISPAIADDTILGLAHLIKIAQDFGIEY